MSRSPNGVRKHTGGWFNSPLMRRSEAAQSLIDQKKAMAERNIPTREEAEAMRAAEEERVTAIFAEASRKDAERRAQSPLTKIIDREARVAVEGDTDLNHDNLEG